MSPALARVLAVLAPLAALSADERGAPSVLRGIFGIGLLLFGPLILGTILGFLQLAVYKLLRVAPASVPMFPILVLRGMIALIAIIAATLFWLKASGRALPFTG